ncbi:TIGR01212 family radical SAM protein [Paraferrimonas haliotis]|uniref:TIGR01212 family radical SAM protein n=1 Tax=Paraferrimonas haliotis TaxID=2013866 RepID=A0AA37WY24_9GAMM|nr:TIGR01212 family radical SAM protein [Paraferrimonas haliotis]GLS82491.1 TIGR01212 family radical SAM protein [Paraferrimonas haliotis]
MGLEAYVNTLGQYCQKHFGQRLQKLTIDAGFDCPNRDGSLGVGGCTFCNVQSFSHEHGTQASISEQLAKGKQNPKRGAKRYLAYFQAYTSTYDELQVLKRKYQEAIHSGMVDGLCIGTRPDCVADSVLDLLQDYQNQGYEIWLELGLQTSNNKTLKRINRGHDFAAYADTLKRAQGRNIKVCCHLILGLPGETLADYRQSLDDILRLGVDGIKLHPLHIVEGSTMAKAWRAGRLETMTLDEYTDAAVDLIRRTPAQVVFHRVTAYAKPPMLLAPDWAGFRWPGNNMIVEKLRKLGPQGSALNDPELKFDSSQIAAFDALNHGAHSVVSVK